MSRLYCVHTKIFVIYSSRFIERGEDCKGKKKGGKKFDSKNFSGTASPSILFSHTTHTSHRSRRPLLKALGGSSPESSTSPDARSVTCVRRMTEKSGRACCVTETFRIKTFTPPFFFSSLPIDMQSSLSSTMYVV